MIAVLERRFVRPRRRRHVERHDQRLDIQGLRMVAILTVLANHLWGWPEGGFVGVDVFFVISGFLITGNLLRSAQTNGTVPFRSFYWNRIRRIVPAATVVLIVTVIASALVYQPFRTKQIGIDALSAFAFMSNWRFSSQGTDYFTANDAASPVQHYWSLSIEEQFYFVWPALIFVVCLVVLRNGWSHGRRMGLAGGIMATVIVVSLTWAVIETGHSPTAAYFNTFGRVWELGVGALLATAVGLLSRIPGTVRPLLSWLGLALIAVSVLVIHEGAMGFPAPWALLPVAGSALVIAAGVHGEPRYQGFLRNPVSTYIGNCSYSLYLVHWPVIVILSALMERGPYFFISALALSFGLAVLSYHFVENPLRRADWAVCVTTAREVLRRRYRVRRSSRYAALGGVALLTVGLCSYALRPPTHASPTLARESHGTSASTGAQHTQLGPLAMRLQDEIVTALQAVAWPALDPSMESVLADKLTRVAEASGCGLPAAADINPCTWGDPAAPTRILLAGNSVASGYIGPLREIALASQGQIQFHTEAMPGCNFVNDLIDTGDPRYKEACPARKQHTVDLINATRPGVVVISNTYARKMIGDRELTPQEWAESMRQLLDQFRSSTDRIVLLAPPPGYVDIGECYGKRNSVPADCVGEVDSFWLSMAEAEQELAESVGGLWIDSRPWFCSGVGLCPSFVGATPTKFDAAHLVPAYGEKIYPVMAESFRAQGAF